MSTALLQLHRSFDQLMLFLRCTAWHRVLAAEEDDIDDSLWLAGQSLLVYMLSVQLVPVSVVSCRLGLISAARPEHAT